jgi:hypothetical protein
MRIIEIFVGWAIVAFGIYLLFQYFTSNQVFAIFVFSAGLFWLAETRND